nr:hypothetical protein BaRGS_032998 [Batillaria attramentaria]
MVAAMCFLVVACVSLLVCVVMLLHHQRAAVAHTEHDTCDAGEKTSRSEYLNAPLTPFSELTEAEVVSVHNYLLQHPSLGLIDVRKVSIRDNFVHVMEARVPKKAEVLDWLERGGPMPERVARAYIFRGNATPPVVEEYEVGPLPNPSYARLVRTPQRKTSIPYSVRPFSRAEFADVFRRLLPMLMRQVGQLLEESYGAKLGKGCRPRCLRLSMTPISSAFLPPDTRSAWFWLAYDLEFYTLHPLDLQFLVDTSHTDSSRWSIRRVYYAGQYFSGLGELAEKYARGIINVTRTAFPSAPESEVYSSLYMRGDTFPEEGKPPPVQVLPRGNRFKVRGSRVEYMLWSFTLRISPTVGIQLFDINFNKERIAYELSLQEIAVLYAGHTPAASMLYFADSAGLFGTRMRGLLEGVDCPSHAVYLDTKMFASNDGGLARFARAVCLFEHNTEVPLRRHRAYSMSGAFYGGLSDTVLILRAFMSLINYDYVVDYIFHVNGVVELKISSTGYLATSFYLPEEERFGTRVNQHVTAGLHQHLFHVKADLDIAGTSNTFGSWNVGVEKKKDDWGHDPSASHVQTVISKHVRRSESEACYNYDFNSPKYLLISGGNVSDLGHRRAYRIIPRGMTPALLPEGDGFEPSVSWSRCQVAVTRHHDDEPTSSSIFAMWDAKDPVVNFAKFMADDENIEDQVKRGDS